MQERPKPKAGGGSEPVTFAEYSSGAEGGAVKKRRPHSRNNKSRLASESNSDKNRVSTGDSVIRIGCPLVIA